MFSKFSNLKKIISVKTLTKRSDQQIQSPSLYNKKGRKAKPMGKVDEKALKIASTS